MKEWLKRIEEWSKRNDAVVDKDRYSIGLFVLVLAGFCLQLPLILNVIIQVSFFVCTLHLIYRNVKGGYYIMAFSKVGLIVAVGLIDDIYYHILFSK